MRSFETVRGVYKALYAIIWVFAVLAIVGSIVAWLNSGTDGIPLLTLIGIITGVAFTALVLSQLLLITICAIDSRNFLADMRQFQIDRLEQRVQNERQQGDRYDRNF